MNNDNIGDKYFLRDLYVTITRLITRLLNWFFGRTEDF